MFYFHVECFRRDFEEKVEAPVGFEPTNKVLQDFSLRPLGYSALNLQDYNQ